jgi:hypothetical protein
VTIHIFEDCITLEQADARDPDTVLKVTLSMVQLRDLVAAVDLPEGSYRIAPPKS